MTWAATALSLACSKAYRHSRNAQCYQTFAKLVLCFGLWLGLDLVLPKSLAVTIENIFVVYLQNYFNCSTLYLYNNLSKPLCTVCSFSISCQTSGPSPPPNFRRHAPNWMWNRDSQKKIEKKNFTENLKKKIFFAIFFTKFFHENAERSVAFGECIIIWLSPYVLFVQSS
jgi:hypothetical protein